MAIRITGLNSGLDTETIISALVSAYNYKVEKYEKAQTKLSWKQDAWKSLNTKIYSLYTTIGNYRYSTAYNLKSATSSDSTKVSVSSSNSAVNGTYSVQVTQLAKTAYVTSGEMSLADTSSTDSVSTTTTLSELGYTGGDTTITVNGKEISVNGDTKLSSLVTSLKDANLSANFDETYGRLYISAKTQGEAGNFDIEGDEDVLSVLGLTSSSGMVDIDGQDSVIYVNGAKYTGTSNSFTINGLTIEATGVTGDSYDSTGASAVTATVSTDTQGIYDKIKDFFTQYNALINEMNSLYNADSAKGYEPLTDDEKDAMSDTEIEAWEEKIKSALLRRDDTLESLISNMTSAMSKGVTVNGKNYYLSSFGIQTLGYLNAAENEEYAYHIYGDEDDSATSGETDKLMAAITNDPDTVIDFMKGLASNLYSAIDSKMKSTTLSSVYTVYNDKEMASEYSDYTDLIAKWEEKLEDKEDYYYSKFSAMETALAKLNASSSSLSSMLG